VAVTRNMLCQWAVNSLAAGVFDADGDDVGVGGRVFDCPNGSAGAPWHDFHRVTGTCALGRNVFVCALGNVFVIDAQNGDVTRLADLEDAEGNVYNFGDGLGRRFASCVCAMDQTRVAVGTRWAGGEIVILANANEAADQIAVQHVADLSEGPANLGAVSAIVRMPTGGFTVFGHQWPWRWGGVVTPPSLHVDETYAMAALEIGEHLEAQRSGVPRDDPDVSWRAMATAETPARVKLYDPTTGGLIRRVRATAIMALNRLKLDPDSASPPWSEDDPGYAKQRVWIEGLMPRFTWRDGLIARAAAGETYIQFEFPMNQWNLTVGSDLLNVDASLLPHSAFKIVWLDAAGSLRARRYRATYAQVDGSNIILVGLVPSGWTPVAFEALGRPVVVATDAGLAPSGIVKVFASAEQPCGEWLGPAARAGQNAWAAFAPAQELATGATTYQAEEIRGYAEGTLLAAGVLSPPVGDDGVRALAWMGDYLVAATQNGTGAPLAHDRDAPATNYAWNVSRYDVDSPYALVDTTPGEIGGEPATDKPVGFANGA